MPSPLHREPSAGSAPLRVGFDVSSAAGRRPRGIASYIRSLLPALKSAAPWIEPVLFLRDERWFRRSSLSDLLPGAKRRWIFEPIKAPLAGLDVFHGMGTRLPKSSRVPRSFTLHDLRGFDLEGASPPSNKPTRIGRRERTIRQADRILCISEHGKARLLHHFPDLDPMTIEVIHHAVDHERFHPRDESERRTALSRLGINAPFFLQLGSFSPHKNLELALEGFARSRASREDYQLMFVGGGGSDSHRARLRELVDALGLSGRVAWVDDISATALPVILSAARGLLMPSRYEDFGLPILEAMASGVPGVCSDATCLPEIAGGVWDTCDPDDADTFAASIDLLAFDDEEHAKRGTDGITRAGLFTWDSCAERTAAFLGRVAESARSS